MSLEDIPVIRFEEIQGTKEMALDAYEKIRGKKLNRQTIGEIFYTMRLLDRYQISPFPYFACMIQAIPKPEYIRDFQLEAIITDPLPTISIPLIDVIEATIYHYTEQYRRIEPINIQFDPFNVEWRTATEFDLFMNVIEDYKMDDIRYEHYITIIWNC